MITVASFNVENLFARPKEFNTGSWQPVSGFSGTTASSTIEAWLLAEDVGRPRARSAAVENKERHGP